MKSKIEITTSKYPFEEYYKCYNLTKEVQEKLNTTDFLALPQRYNENEFYFAQETIDFLKFCKNICLEHSIDYLADGDIKIRSLHSFDIWLPVIFIAANILLPMAVNLVSSYIYDKMKGREHEDANIEVTFIVKSKTEEKALYYKGNAKEFKDSFEKIDINKL